MGMAAHVVIASRDGSVFAHLHPSGSISMAAMQKFDRRAAPAIRTPATSCRWTARWRFRTRFRRPAPYRIFVQVKRGGRVMTAAFDVDVQPRAASS